MIRIDYGYQGLLSIYLNFENFDCIMHDGIVDENGRIKPAIGLKRGSECYYLVFEEEEEREHVFQHWQNMNSIDCEKVVFPSERKSIQKGD